MAAALRQVVRFVAVHEHLLFVHPVADRSGGLGRKAVEHHFLRQVLPARRDEVADVAPFRRRHVQQNPLTPERVGGGDVRCRRDQFTYRARIERVQDASRRCEVLRDRGFAELQVRRQVLVGPARVHEAADFFKDGRNLPEHHIWSGAYNMTFATECSSYLYYLIA